MIKNALPKSVAQVDSERSFQKLTNEVQIPSSLDCRVLMAPDIKNRLYSDSKGYPLEVVWEIRFPDYIHLFQSGSGFRYANFHINFRRIYLALSVCKDSIDFTDLLETS